MSLRLRRSRGQRARRRTLGVVAVLMLVALVIPTVALSLNSFYVNRVLNAGETDHHPTTRVWLYNDMLALAPQATRIWIYIPGSGYYYDSGNQIGALHHGAPASNTTIWCQNWSGGQESAQCLGGYN